MGQNGLRQAEVFSEAAKLSGVVLTKLDGTAKGGIALAIAQQLGLPIRFIGAGEGIEDLRPFSSIEGFCMSEQTKLVSCSDMQKQLLPSNSLQTGVFSIKNRTVALSLVSQPRPLMRGVWGSESPK